MTKVTLPNTPKYDFEVGERRVVITWPDGYCHEQPSKRGHYMVTMCKTKTNEVREVCLWDTLKTAKQHAKNLRNVVGTGVLEQIWKKSEKLIPFR